MRAGTEMLQVGCCWAERIVWNWLMEVVREALAAPCKKSLGFLSQMKRT